MRVPKTLAGVERRLATLGGIAHATDWERAGIVYAFTRDDATTAHRIMDISIHERESFRQFAERGFVGLRTHPSVARYHRAWAIAVDEGEVQPTVPGGPLKVPREQYTFPPNAHEYDSRSQGVTDREAIEAQAEVDGTGAAKALDIAKNLKAMVAAIKASPKVAAAAAEAVREHRRLHFDSPPDPREMKRPRSVVDVLTTLRGARVAVQDAVVAAERSGPFDDEMIEIIRETAQRIRVGCDYLDTIADAPGGISDAALHEWIDTP